MDRMYENTKIQHSGNTIIDDLLLLVNLKRIKLFDHYPQNLMDDIYLPFILLNLIVAFIL